MYMYMYITHPVCMHAGHVSHSMYQLHSHATTAMVQLLIQFMNMTTFTHVEYEHVQLK